MSDHLPAALLPSAVRVVDLHRSYSWGKHPYLALTLRMPDRNSELSTPVFSLHGWGKQWGCSVTGCCVSGTCGDNALYLGDGVCICPIWMCHCLWVSPQFPQQLTQRSWIGCSVLVPSEADRSLRAAIGGGRSAFSAAGSISIVACTYYLHWLQCNNICCVSMENNPLSAFISCVRNSACMQLPFSSVVVYVGYIF